MPQSKRFYELSRRLTELRRHMLPAKFSSTGLYTPREEDRARGYRLLAHAEIESYLEDRIRVVVIEKINNWKKTGRPSNLIIAFLACYHSGWTDYPSGIDTESMNTKKSRRQIKEAIEEIVDQASKQFMNILMKNNGVREQNLKTLILPTGIDLRELDASWIADLDDRGGPICVDSLAAWLSYDRVIVR